MKPLPIFFLIVTLCLSFPITSYAETHDLETYQDVITPDHIIEAEENIFSPDIRTGPEPDILSPEWEQYKKISEQSNDKVEYKNYNVWDVQRDILVNPPETQ